MKQIIFERVSDIKKKILIINAPAYDQSKAFFPPDIAYLVSAFEKNNISCDVFDANFDSDKEKKVIDAVSTSYNFVCIFADCYPFPYSDNYAFPYMLKIAKQIKKVSDVPILIGGRYATLHHKEIVACHDCFDIIVRGDVERVVVEIYKNYINKGCFSVAFPGITYLKFQGKQKISDIIRIEENLDELPFPSQEVQERYLIENLPDGSRKMIIPIMSSRGCPYNCKYCSSTIYKRKWSARSPESVAEEIYVISQKYGDILVRFVDDNFYVDPFRAKSIVNRFIEKCDRIIEFTFCARADQIVKHGMDNLLFFKKHGCNSIEIGIENGSSDSLQNYGKGTTVDQNLLALNMVRSARIFPSVDYIMFEPETSLNDLKENLDFIKKSKLWGYYHPVLYSKVVPLEGTQYEKYLSLSDKQYFSHEEVFYVYTYMKKFMENYQGRINKLIDKMNDLISNKSMINKRQYIWLRTLPYIFFSELIYSRVPEKANFFEAFSIKERIDQRLNLIEQQFDEMHSV